MNALLHHLGLILLVSFSYGIPLQSDDLSQIKSETSQPAITSLDNEGEDSTETSHLGSISFCSPACEQALVNPCGQNGECAEGHECCLDMCLSSTVCRPISSSKLSYHSQPVTTVEETPASHVGEENPVQLESDIPAASNDTDGLIKRSSSQYDALTYGTSPDEYHRYNPLDEQQPLYGDSNETVTELPEDSTAPSSDLFNPGRRIRSAQDETGSFPHVPVRTFELSDVGDRIQDAFQDFADNFRQDEDNVNSDTDNDNLKVDVQASFSSSEGDSILQDEQTDTTSLTGQSDTEQSSDSLTNPEDEESLLSSAYDSVSESVGSLFEDEEDNSTITRRKRSDDPEVTFQSPSSMDGKLPNVDVDPNEPPPTFIFVKKVPGMSLKALVNSGDATITKIVAPYPLDLNGTEADLPTTTVSPNESTSDYQTITMVAEVQGDGQEGEELEKENEGEENDEEEEDDSK